MHRMTPDQTQRIGHEKYPLNVHCSIPQTPTQIFVPVALRLAVFEIFHTLGFPIDSHVKISKCHQFS